MTTLRGSREAFPSQAASEDEETARAHESIRRTLSRLLSEATPTGWAVVTGARCTSGDRTVDVDIAVRAALKGETEDAPVLCVDIAAGAGANEDPRQRARLRSLARMGVDHYWSLDTVAVAFEVWLRSGQEYRHAETLTQEDWLDYGIGVVRLDPARLSVA